MTTKELLMVYKELSESKYHPECYPIVTKILLAILKEIKERL